MQKFNNNKNIIIAATISLVFMVIWQYFFPPIPLSQESKEEIVELDKSTKEIKQEKIIPNLNLPAGYVVETTKSVRVFFENNKIRGSINPVGLKIDDLTLKNYAEGFNLLSPAETKNIYFAQFGFTSSEEGIILPSNQTIWNLKQKDNKIIALFTNPQNITFQVTFTLDENYMFDVEQKIVNRSGKEIQASSFVRIFRSEGEGLENTFISHEGFIGAFDNKLNEFKYSKIKDVKRLFFPMQTEIVWAGFVDKYWLTAFFYPNTSCSENCSFIKSDISFNSIKEGASDRFQTDLITEEVKIPNGSSTYFPLKFFAGAKELKLLDRYESEGFKIGEKKYPLKHLENAIDYGIFYFLTKPIFLIITFINSFTHNFGFSIILLTVIIKFLLYPIAKKSYVSMAKMKMVAPEVEHIKKITEDKLERNRRIMDVYKKNAVNPLAGCLPILLQIPVFFALYKVLFISIEMKGAPFIWWINDLSAKDPTSFVNLFGLLPFSVPVFLQIGVLPILLGLTTYLQQRLSPKSMGDPTQAMILKTMPFILIFVFASFPSGIVLYWIINNLLSITQQLYVEKIIIPKAVITFQKRLKEGK